MKQQPTQAERRRSIAARVKGFFGTIACVAVVIVAIVLMAPDSPIKGARGWAGWVIPAIVAAVTVVLLAVPVLYLVVRSRARKREQAGDDVGPALSRARSALAPIAARIDDSTNGAHGLAATDPYEGALGSARLARTDASRLTAANLAARTDPWDKLRFIYQMRSVQADNFLASPDYAHLPESAKDAVALVDLAKELELKGLAQYLGTPGGFYSHDVAAALAAARRTGNGPIADLLGYAQATTRNGAALAPNIEAQLRALLDAEATWGAVAAAIG